MEYPSKTLEIIFLIEASASMQGSKIGMINAAIEELIPEIRDIAETRPESKINIRCISYASGSQWRCLEHIPAQTFRWEYLDAEGRCDLGSGILRLNKFLEESNMSVNTHYRPVIFLFNASTPTDNTKYALFKISETEWYKRALKVGVLIGDGACEDIVKQFTGNARNVMSVYTPEALKKWINFFETR